MNSTLPLEIECGLTLKYDDAVTFGAQFAESYLQAEPFPHIVLDKFLPDRCIELIYRSLSEQLNETVGFENAVLQHKKVSIDPTKCEGFAKELFLFFNSAPFLQFLESLTKIKGLLPDPYFGGGGFHKSYRGGRLGIHTDFRLHPTLNLQRRLNVLIYLNKDWNPNWGGELELWDLKMKSRVHAIQPLINRCVIFNTDSRSFHGHPEPLLCPEGTTRNSIALYYYTSGHESTGDGVNLSTMFKARPSDTPFVKWSVMLSRIQQYCRLQNIVPPLMYHGMRKAYRALRHNHRHKKN